MALPPGFLDELRARVSLAKVVERKVTWDKRKTQAAKGDYWACCPFHQETTPSFHVEDRKGFYYCFGCHAKGDAITFLREAENMDFMEAVQVLAQEAGMPMPERDPQAAKQQDRRARLAEVMEAAAQFFRLQFRAAKGQEARGYIQRRGLSEATVERFEIGYAPDSRNALKEHLAGKNIDMKEMDETGLVIVPDDGGTPYDRFRGRVMFPIRDARGRCIAFGGRALSADVRAKYLNSPETLLFDKGRSLYNHGPAREAAGKAGALVVAEGYMDVVALAQAGFAHAVAPLGTAITEDQLRLMWRIADEPVIALDGDKAGMRAAMRVIDIALPMLEPGKSLRFALMPEGQDPDDLIKAQGAGAMQGALDKALPMVELLWRREIEGQVFDSPERRSALDARLRAALGKIGDANLRAHYGQAIKERRAQLFAPIAALRPATAQNRAQGGKGWRGGRAPTWAMQAGAMPSPEVKLSALARDGGLEAEARGREATLVLTLINHPDLAQNRVESLEDVEFVCRDLETIRRALISAITSDEVTADRSAWLAEIERLIGQPPLPVLLATPLGREARFASEDADPEMATYGFEEMLSRHRALISFSREVQEAEVEMAEDAGEELDRRLEAASSRRFVDATPSLPDANEDEEHLRSKLKNAFDEQIWVKRSKR
ncbi:MAG: DNA primase [Pseudomonadota bacterium]